jgi:hypothetical protein
MAQSFRSVGKTDLIATHVSEIFDSNITLSDYPLNFDAIESAFLSVCSFDAEEQQILEC